MGTRSDDAAGRNELRQLSRRRFLAGTAGMAAAVSTLTSLGPLAPAALADDHGHGNDHGHGHDRDRNLTVAPERRGIILFTVRDVVTRAPNPALGLNGGFRYVFEQLSAMGYHEVEFAGYTQNTSILGRQITPAEIRQLLDDNGLKANGSHINFNFADPASFEAQLDIAETLGMPHLGTASIPTNSRFKADWQTAADNFNAFGERAKARGIKLYQHNHHAEYNFLLDAGPLDANGKPTASSGLRGLEYFFGLVDPKLVWFEMDIFWGYVAQHRYPTYTDKRGVVRTDTFDPIRTVQQHSHRFPLFHVKDGVPADVPDGYTMVPAGTGVIPLRKLLNEVGDREFRHPNYEQDNAPGGTANPGQSLQFSQTSYTNIAGWQQGRCS
jgi:sugar phosphate isomerase/epimerase